jgi:MoaA/NifB/PqqE/SkfB family radical SAM enzyme/glycosyltransferase involved in cell wall biosynthesis
MDISVVVPTYNRREKLARCLDSLFAQDHPRERFEIIVVDDGSGDQTTVLLEGLAKEHPHFRYFSQSHKGPAAARNLGIKEARADILGFTDDDCILGPDWVRRMVEAHRSHPHAAAVGGATRVDIHRVTAAVSQYLSDGSIVTPIDGKQEAIFFPTCNVSVKKAFLAEGFDEMFPLPAGEDLDFFWRLFKKGHRFVHDKNIEIFHDCHGHFISFLRQAYMYGRGNYLVQHIHGDHPLLKELKSAGRFRFIAGTVINLLKIPRFSYSMGSRLIRFKGPFVFARKLKIYFLFALHKFLYVGGNIAEYRRLETAKGRPKTEGPGALSGDAKPEFIILDLTHRCNLACRICEIRKDAPIKEFTTDEVKDLIGQAMAWGVKEFVLSGGEPLLREDIFEILSFVKEKDYRLGILSNGIILDDDFLEKITPYLISGAVSLSISLDALTPGIHDDIRGASGSFRKTTQALKKIAELKKAWPSLNFNVISIVLNENLEELLSLAHFLKSCDVNSIQFQPLLSNNLVMRERSQHGRYWISRERWGVLDRVMEDLAAFKRQHPAFVRNSENNLRLIKKYFRGMLAPGDVKCLYATRTLLIASNGDVTTCLSRYGNVRQQPLKKIYFSREAREAREAVGGCKSPCLLPCFCD